MPAHAQKSKIAVWMQLVRAPFFTASLIPVIIGAMLALNSRAEVQWPLLPIVILCAVLFHGGTNIVSEYFDFSKGVDRKDTFGSSRVLVEGLLPPRQALIAGVGLFAIGFLLGLIIVTVRGIPILILGIIGLIGGYCYTGQPIGFKYRAAGDIGVFLLMGPLLVIASYSSLTGIYTRGVLYASIPIGFLVTAILNANNLRDIQHDKEARVATLENILGFKKARFGYFFLIIGAYAAVVLMIFARLLCAWSLLVFLSFPLAYKNMRLLTRSKTGQPHDFPMLDLLTAKLHLAFGALFILSLGLQALIPSASLLFQGRQFFAGHN